MIEKNIFLICLVVLTLILILLCFKYIVSEKEKRKMMMHQKEVWSKELLELSESLQYMLSDDIRALETYKMIEEIYPMVFRAHSEIAQKNQKIRLMSYNKAYNKNFISTKSQKEKKMLRIFTKSSCQSSRMAKKWLNQFRIDYKEQDIKRMSRKDLIHIVSLSETGFDALLIGKTARATNARAFIIKLSFEEAIDFLLENPTLLRSPLIVGENKLQIGYYEQEMRKFIPREIRKIKRRYYEKSVS